MLTTKQVVSIATLFKNPNSRLPILECALLTDDRLDLDDLTLRVSIPYKTGVTSLPSIVPLLTALQTFSNPEFSLFDANRKIAITEGKQTIKIPSDKLDNFPIRRDTATEKVGEFLKEDLSLLFDALNFASDHDLRPAITHVSVDTHIVSTDAHRLFYHKLATGFSSQVLLSKKLIKIIKIIGEGFTVYVSPENEKLYERVKLVFPCGIEIVAVKCDAIFPNWTVVKPNIKDATAKVVFNTEDFRKIIKTGLKFANKSTQQCLLEINQDGGTFKTADVDFEMEFTAPLPISKVEYLEPITIAFNGCFLDEILSKCGKEFTLYLWTPHKCGIIDDKYLLMPLMLNN